MRTVPYFIWLDGQIQTAGNISIGETIIHDGRADFLTIEGELGCRMLDLRPYQLEPNDILEFTLNDDEPTDPINDPLLNGTGPVPIRSNVRLADCDWQAVWQSAIERSNNDS